MRTKIILPVLAVFFSLQLAAQSKYRYQVDLTKVKNDNVEVSLLTPKVTASTATLSFPKIIPGTYRVSDYGLFISNVHAFTKDGKELDVKKLNDNQWEIKKAKELHKITYTVDDAYDAKVKHNMYPMAATNIEEKDVVVHTPGFFGFIEGITKVPFEMEFIRPAEFYGSTSLKPVISEKNRDVFSVDNVDVLYDSPIMYSVPDTATMKVGNCEVLVSVYSPNKLIHAKQIIEWMGDFLNATQRYLGGNLPADKYAFLYYFKDPSLEHSFPPGLGGALEHNTSSFYYLFENPQSFTKNFIVDISAHEFFHIITPLTVSSKEVKEFNWNESVMSKHLWLYEGVTEYSSHHVQVATGLNTMNEFLKKMSDKITNSRANYDDKLPFTELSKNATGSKADEYNNVYQKGALIGACLDLQLLSLSEGKYGLRELMKDLGTKYGKDKFFNDDELFDVITKMTYPQIGEFFKKHVEGGEPIPYDYYFGLAGIKYAAQTEVKQFSLGGIGLGATEKGGLAIVSTNNLNDLGKALGYKTGDEIYSVNGKDINATNFGEVIPVLRESIKPGDDIEVKIGRKNSSGAMDTLTLKTKFALSTQILKNQLTPVADPTPLQQKVRNSWLNTDKKAF